VRTKGKAQIVAEVEALYCQGWKGDIFIVDDNFIGNRGRLKRDILPAMSIWMEARGHPYTFNTKEIKAWAGNAPRSQSEEEDSSLPFSAHQMT